MDYKIVEVDLREVIDWDTFHDTFAREFGFPSFYGRNMNAWIDCMTSLDDPEDGLSTVHAPPDGLLVLQLAHMKDLRVRLPEIANALEECAAFVNWRRLEVNEAPILALSY